jgi:peptide/nickel transport system substrate-binding protein
MKAIDRRASILITFSVAILLNLAVVVVPSIAQDNPTSKLDPNSKDRELIARAPFDRITLIDNSSWEVETLTPRPLPAIDPKKSKSRPKTEEKPEKPRDGNIGMVGQKSTFQTPKTKEEEEEASFILIHMLQGDIRDYKVKREHIKSVEYFEDMLIKKAGDLISEGQFRKAFEYLLFTKTRQAKWPGLEDMDNRLLFEEGSKAVIEADAERGLRLLNELYVRDPKYPGLGDKLAMSFSARINGAIDLGAYTRGREVLHELEGIAPEHQVVKDSRTRYERKAREEFDRSAGANPPDKLDALLSAAEIWPKLDGLESAYKMAFEALPTIDVAVSDLPQPIGPWLRSTALRRVSPLVYRPLLSNGSEEAMKGTLPNQLAAGIETFELSKGIRIKLKPGIIWSDGSRPVGAIDVARSLADRAVPTLPGYSARWADLVERVEVTEDDRVEVRLTRPSLRPELFLIAPVGPAHAAGDGWVNNLGQGRQPVGDGPFHWLPSSKPNVDQYLLNKPTSDTPKRIHRVREIRYDTPTAAVAAFVRGETTLLEHLSPDRLAEVSVIPDIKIGKYQTPSLHRIAIDGRTSALRNRSLRRALSLSIDRRILLEESILRRSADAQNAVADGPFLKGSYADAVDVLPLVYDPLLAKMLVAAARKELGGSPVRLTLEYPPTAIARAICPKLAEAWMLVGVELVLKEVPEGELESRLRSGGRFDLAYRASRPGDPSVDGGPTICPGYDAPPSSDPLASLASPRILQLLMELDRAPETTQVQSLLLQVDRESRDELPILPLWQITEHYAWRTRLKGIPAELDQIYQSIETWEIEPWFPHDPW